METYSKRIDVNGISTHFHEKGEGEPVILIHGSGPGVTAWANWRLVIPKLSENFHVYAPDMIGFGDTERPDNVKYGMELWTEHLINFIEAIDQGPVNIIGNSFGGALALHVSKQRPDLVRKLVLMGSMGLSFPISYGLDKVWGYEPSIENMKRILEIFVYDQEFATDELAELRYKASIEKGNQDSFSAMFPEPRQAKVEELALPEEEIKKIDKQTLIVHGKQDLVIPYKETSLRLVELLQNSELHVFSKCGHWTQIEKNKEFNQLCESFLLRE